MFKKRTVKQRQAIEIIEQVPKNDLPDQSGESQAEPSQQESFQRKRDSKLSQNRVNRVTTALQDTTSKDYMNREVQDLTNNYKSSSKAKEMSKIHQGQTEQFLREEEEKDGLHYAKQRQEISKKIRDGELNPKVYRGQNNYASYHNQTEDDLKQKKFSGTLKGPQKAPTFVKVTTRIDHNPERCKDYYEHGYCGFGDTCIFIHDRGDYKSGHQLDQEYEQAKKRKQLKFVRKTPYGRGKKDGCSSGEESNYEIGGNDSDYGDGFPNQCPICEGDFDDPVVTKCKHHFCDGCAIRNYGTDSNCFVCGQATDGVFNMARDLIKHLKNKPEPQPQLSENEQEEEAKEAEVEQNQPDTESNYEVSQKSD